MAGVVRSCFAVVAVALAGCVGASEPSSRVDVSYESRRLFDDSTGAIVGFVLDDSLAAVAGATIVLDGARETVSNDAGAFEFADVTPGDHEVVAAATNFGAASVRATVESGQAQEITFTLIPIASAAAYHETLIESGYIACGAAILGTGWAFCTYTNTAGIDSPLEDAFLDWDFADPYNTDIVGLFGETTWQSTQALGTSLHITWVLAERSGATNPVDNPNAGVASVAGTSPLQVRMPIEAFRGVNDTSFNGHHGVLCTKELECMLLSYHFTYGHIQGFGVTVQQRFDDYVTIFHNGVFPEIYSALSDQ